MDWFFLYAIYNIVHNYDVRIAIQKYFLIWI